jgi:glycosyltransferase involved in cell wall biosynthesis
VICLPNSLLIGLAKPLHEALGRPVCCILQGEDLFLNGLGEPWRGKALDLIRRGVDHVDAFLPVSEYYAEFMRTLLKIPDRKMHVVPLGINLKGLETGYRIRSNCFTVGYFARIAPDKGLHLLSEAYRRLRHDTDFSGAALEAAGYLAPENRAYLRDVETKMKQWNLSDDFRYRGELTRMQKIEFLRNLDVLCVPTTYDEPKGVFALEAMALGIPVVEPRRGAFPEMIRKTSGGLLFEPDDPASLADALYSLWKDTPRTEQLGRNAAAGVREHYPIARMAQRVLEVYQRVQEKAAVAPGH